MAVGETTNSVLIFKPMTHFSISARVLISIILLLLFACSKKTPINYKIITQQYIDSLDKAILLQQTVTTNREFILSPEQILERQIPNRYFETLTHYFTGNIANDEIR